MEEACKLEDSMIIACTEETNAQTRFKAFQNSVLEFAKKRAKTVVGATEKKKKILEDEQRGPDDPGAESENSAALQPTVNDPRAGKSQAEIAELVVAIEKKIDDLVDRQRERKRLETRVHGVTELNHITKYAFNIAKESKPRDTLTYLQRTDITPKKGSRCSSKMAEIMRDYHNDLQSDGLDVAQELRDKARRDTLNSVPLPGAEVDMKPLAEKLTEDDVLKAPPGSSAREAAGINGYTTEFWC
ncbi:hypothetical protein B0H10DRAFT_1948415 [Mycena sp. CBHHK59/15]|nr:hypothetical protein B0H10DRAFT_1948415 [Mycena sp. CBHHK59/15]